MLSQTGFGGDAVKSRLTHGWNGGPLTRNGYDDNDYADVRGAALAVFRRRVFRLIDAHAADPSWWDRLCFPFSQEDLAELTTACKRPDGRAGS